MIPATNGTNRTQSLDMSAGATTTNAPMGSLLQTPSADPLTSMMMMMVKLGSAQRSDASLQEGIDEKQEAAADADRVRTLHDKADTSFTEGMVTGTLDLAAAGATCTSTALSTKANSKELELKGDEAKLKLASPKGVELSPAQEAQRDVAAAKALQTSRQLDSLRAAAAYAGVSGQGTTVAKDFASGTLHKIEGDKDADAASAEAASHRSARQADQARDEKRQGTEDVRFVIDTFKKLQDTTNETNNALARRA